MSRTNHQLSEQVVQDSFHSYLKSSLTQAKVEHLLDADVLSSAEGDLMITGEFGLDIVVLLTGYNCLFRSCIMSILCCSS